MKNHFAARERFLHSSPSGLVQFDEKRLESFLPLARPDGSNEALQRITYRVYLEAIRQFIHDHWEQFLEVLAGQGLKDASNIQSIDIIAEKHGGDYHPARIKVQAADTAPLLRRERSVNTQRQAASIARFSPSGLFARAISCQIHS